nr:hypothetical protein [Tanacetum cinerariifolium]
MRTRSNFYPFNSIATIPKRSNRRRIPNIVESEIRTIEEIVSMADRTMEELLQAPMEGYGEAIVIPEILAENFESKTNLIQDVPNDAIKLMLFPYSLEGAARIWYEKEPPNSILTWDDLVHKFVNQLFPPSKTTHLKNEISHFTQRFEETLGEAWDRFKEMLRACPHHGFSELTQIDTFYNGLTEQDHDFLNAASGVEIVNKQVIAPAKAVEKTRVTCRGAHAYYDCIAIGSNQPSVCAATGSYNQVSPLNRASHQIPPPGFAMVQNNPNSFADALLLMPKFALIIKSLLANKDKLFELTKVPLNENCSAMLLKKLLENLGDLGKFLIPCDFPGMEVCHALADLGESINLMPLSIWKKLSLPELTPTSMTLELADRSITPDPRVPLILGRSFLRTGRALIDVYGEEITLRVNDESITFNLNQTMRYSSTYDDNSVNRVDVIDISCEEFVQDVLDFQYNPKSSSPTLVSDFSKIDVSKEPIVKSSSPTRTPFGEKYAFLEESNKLPVIIAKNLKDVEREALINVLKSYKWAIALKISDIKGIEPRFYTHKILMEDDYKPAVQSQRRVNPKIHNVIKKEVIKLLDSDMIYPISDSPWVSPIHCVPKKGGMTVVANENNELIPTRLVTGWRVCIDYRKLNDATRKDHSPLPFMDQMLEREGIVLGHKISKSGIEVDRAKVDVLAKRPHPTTVKGVRSFLGHAGFYRHFIQDFQKLLDQ